MGKELLGRGLAAALAAMLIAAAAASAQQPVPGLPPGTDFATDAREQPRQILRSEAAGGRQSYMAALGNTAFSSPMLFGTKAREAGLSCDTCHRQGEANARFFIPGNSQRPGGLDPTTALFDPAQEDNVVNHVDIPSLRGVRHLGPFGRDGRIGTLREFARHVIVEEFAGKEPDPRILDALVAYMQEIEFLPNPKLGPQGRLAASADEAARRGEALFAKPFAGLGGKSCASCHMPDSAFTDGRIHDVASGGLFKTPTLLNARFTAPYFHDGRFADFTAVVEHFDRRFALALGPRDKADLVAYLEAVGDADTPYEPVTRQSEMFEVASYVGVLDRAIDARDLAAVSLVVETVTFDLERIARRFDNRNPETGRPRRPDRPDVASIAALLIDDMKAVRTLAEAGQAAKAKEALDTYRGHARQMVSAYRGAAAAAAKD